MLKLMVNISLVILLSFSMSSCEKLTDTTWVYYDETKCADAWGSTENTPEDEKINMIQKYYDNKGIKIFKVKITEDGTYEACKACTCKTGKRVKIKIKESDVETMEDEGFYE